MRRTLLYLILIASCFPGFSQSNQLDSLINLIQTEKVDSIQFKSYIEIADHYQDSAYDKSLKFFNKALAIVEKTNQRKKVAKVYHSIGFMFYNKGEFPTALLNYNNALTILEYMKDKEGAGQVLNDIGLIYKSWGKYEKSIDYFLRALKIFDETGNEKYIAVISNNIGQIYYYRNDYDKAIQYFSIFYEYYKKNNNPRALAGAANNIASAYLEQSKLDEALNYFVKAMKVYDSLSIRIGVAIIKDNIGSLYLRKNQYNDALLYNSEAAKIFEELGSQSRLCSSLESIGLVYIKLNQPDLALKSLSKSLRIANELNQKETIKGIYEALTDVFIQKKEFEKALDSYKNYVAIKDSLLNIETLNKIETIQIEYDSQKKERELAVVHQKLQNQKTLGVIAAGVIILFLFLTSLVIKENLVKKKTIKNSNTQLKNINNVIDKIAKIQVLSQLDKANYLSIFKNHWIINNSLNQTEYLIPFKKGTNIYSAFISYELDSKVENIVKLAIIDFFNSNIDENKAASVKEQFSNFISTDETWNAFGLNSQVLNVDFWCLNNEVNQHFYSGNISALHINETNHQITDLSKSPNTLLDLRKGDRLFFFTSQSLNTLIMSDQNIIQHTINKIIEKSSNLNFEQQKETIENSIDLLVAANGQKPEISILAFQF